MAKRSLVLLLSLLAMALLATSSFAQPCSSGIDVHYVGIGASAEFNTLSFGAADALQNLSSYTAPTNVWTVKTAEVIDTRTTLSTGANPVDKGLSVWVIFDSGTTCNVYVGFSSDAVQGDKAFYCYKKVATGFVGTQAACYGFNDTSESGGSWQTQACVNTVPGNSCSAKGSVLPATIQTFLITPPAPTKTGTKQNLPLPYCGQTGNTSGTPEAATAYCYFNAAHTDIRAEDGLFATTRALSSYNTTNSLYGLGYNQTACGAVVSGTKIAGCPITDSFNGGKVFYPLQFAIKGTDPYTAADVPTGTTLTLGASPVVVFVNNADSTNSLGFGVKQSDGTYLHKNLPRKVLAQIFEGVDACTGDLLATTPTPSAFSGAIPGSGQPIQAIVREPLSGTYNTFEFTGVRTFSGSGLSLDSPAGVMVGLNKITTSTTVGSGPSWISGQESSQEVDVRATLPQGPATGWTAGTNSSHCTPFPDGTQNCGDPLFYQTGNTSGSTASTCAQASAGTNPAVKLRAIGTGEEIGAVLGTTASPEPSAWTVTDGIGYAYWGYSNFKPAGASGCTSVTAGGGTGAACTDNIGHYLTVDSIDPLFDTAGGASTLPGGSGPENWSGAYEFPQCALIQGISGAAFPCPQIPFAHIYDGAYPIWTMYRIVSFSNVTAGSTTNGVTTPEGVINVAGYAQTEAAPGSASQLSDFAPFLSSIGGLPYTQGGTAPTGNLNLGVFRVHSLNSDVPTGNTVAPNNGHSGCGSAFNFTGVALQGGTSGHATCLVDTGSDVGGAVETVRADVDFILDLGGAAVDGAHFPTELYNLHQ